MTDDFRELINEIEDEAQAEGPEAARQLEELRADFTLASELMHLRRLRKLTQKRLAQLSGVPQSEISRIETGAANPTVATLTALAHPLGAEVGLVRR